MIIQFSSNVKGWAEYVYKGTKKKPRDNKKVKIIDGDLTLTKNIYESTKARYSYDNIVIAMKGKMDNDILENVYKDFKSLFLKSYREDEYNISAVIHQDTANSHIHICIPRLNLLTNTINTYYYDKYDRSRLNLIKQYLETKYDIEPVRELQEELKKENINLEIINKQRTAHGQALLKLPKNIKRHKTLKVRLNKIINELYNSGNITDLNDLKYALKELSDDTLTAEFNSFNNKTYIAVYKVNEPRTIENTIKIEGDYIGKIFRHSRKHINQAGTELNGISRKNDISNSEGKSEKLERLRNQIESKNQKYSERLNRRIGRARTKARERLNSISQTQSSNNNNSVTINNDINNNIKLGNHTTTTISGDRKEKLLPAVDVVALRLPTENQEKELNKNDRIYRKMVKLKCKSGTIGGHDFKGHGERADFERKGLRELRARIIQYKGRANKLEQFIQKGRSRAMSVYDEIKKYNISDIIQHIGGVFKANKSTNKTHVIRYNNNTLLVSNVLLKKGENRYLYYNTDTGKGGSIVDFYINELGVSGKTINIALGIKRDYGTIKYTNTLKALTQAEAIAERSSILESLDLIDVKGLPGFLKDRGISLNTFEMFNSKKDIKKEKLNEKYYFNTFLYLNDNFEKIGYEIKGHNIKRTLGAKGIYAKSITNNNSIQKDKNYVYIFESVIDAMSYYELTKQQGIYISIGGNVSNEQLSTLNHLTSNLSLTKEVIVNMMLDDDDAGVMLSNKISNNISSANNKVNILMQTPTDLATLLNIKTDTKGGYLKDMNDILKYKIDDNMVGNNTINNKIDMIGD